MATSGKQITAITKGRLISLRADFPVNPSATRGSGEETGTIATSGLRCLEQFAKYVPDGSLRKMFARSEEHTSELQSLMRISYAVFCLEKKKNNKHSITKHNTN